MVGSIIDKNSGFFGYLPPVSNTTYTPNQFFDVVLPHSSRGCVRLVAYMIRKTLGWCDAEGNPQEPQTTISYSKLINEAGISRGAIGPAISEAVQKKFIREIQAGRAASKGDKGCPALYELNWDNSEQYIKDPELFNGFFSGNGNLTYIPNAFFDYTVQNESLAVVKVVGTIIRYTIGFQSKYGFRRQHIKMSYEELSRKSSISSSSNLYSALKTAILNNHITVIEAGFFDTDSGKKSSASIYGLRWTNTEQTTSSSKLEATTSPTQNPGQFKNRGGQAVQNQMRQQFNKRGESSSESDAQKQYKNRCDIEIKHKIKTTNNQVPPGRELSLSAQFEDLNFGNSGTAIEKQSLGSSARAVAVDFIREELEMAKLEGLKGHGASAMIILLKEGFDKKSAKYLAETYPLERIRRQCEYIEKRNYSKNKLGYLRKSIEEDWSNPEEAKPQKEPVKISNNARKLFKSPTQEAPKMDEQTAKRKLEQLEKELQQRWPEKLKKFMEEEQKKIKEIESMPMVSKETVNFMLNSFTSPENKLRRIQNIVGS